MGFTEKLEGFFNSKGLKTKRDIAKAISTNEQVLGRWLKSNDLSITFIERLTERFPDIDLNYLLKNNKEEEAVFEVREPTVKYEKESEDMKIVAEIEEKLKELREFLAQKRNNK